MTEQSSPPSGLRARRSPWRWLMPLIPAIIIIAVVKSIYSDLHYTVWSSYTDDAGIEFAHGEQAVRTGLWEDPYLLPGDFNRPSMMRQAAFSPDGATMVFSQMDPETAKMNLYLSIWDGVTWSKERPLKSINDVDHNDSGPAFSVDGKELIFASDRKGGLGGYDLWLSARQAGKWQAPIHLGEHVNSKTDDLSPEFSPRGEHLYFNSDRNGKMQIYALKVGNEDGRLVFLEGHSPDSEPALSSAGEDQDAAWSPDGRRLFISSDREGGLGGMDLYTARVLGGTIQRDQNAGSELNTSFDESAPSLRWQGYDMLLNSNRRSSDPDKYQLFHSSTREVVSRLDLSRWNRFLSLIDRVKWYLLGMAAALAALIWMLQHWKDFTDLFQKCLFASVLVHVALLVIFFFYRIAQEVSESVEPESMEVAIEMDNLAQEKLALEMEEQVTELPDAPVVVPIEQVVDAVPVPEFVPQDIPIKAPPVITQTSKDSFVVKVTPSAAREQTLEVAATEAVMELPELELPELDISLEEFVPEPSPDQPDVQETFEPVVKQQEVTVEKQEFKKPELAAIQKEATESDVMNDSTNAVSAEAMVKDTGGDLVVASAGLEALGQLPELIGTDDLVGLMSPSSDPGDELLIDAPGKLDVPAGAGDVVSAEILKNPGKLSLETIEGLGGNSDTQGAIARALVWFSRNQEADGRWDVKKHGGGDGYDIAGTSMALLCYYGWGATHNEKGPYKDNVDKAIKWLVKKQEEKGHLMGPAGHGMYNHGIAAIALSEAYGVSGDESLKAPAQKAIDFIVNAQHKQTGGWRYKPNSGSDTSVFGWQYMALKSAEIAGLNVDPNVFKDADRWLDKVGGGKHGGIYGYTAPGHSHKAMIPTGMFCRQLAKVPPTDPRMKEGADYLRMNPIKINQVDYYYLYYGTLALYQHQGPAWEEWNTRMKQIVPDAQIKNGEHSGSWNPSGSHSSRMGRVVTTGIATLSLEVYYRILPIYGFRSDDESTAK